MSETEWPGTPADPMDFDPDELREFLAADLMDVPVSSSFKEQLRSKLWKLVQRTYGHAGDDPS